MADVNTGVSTNRISEQYYTPMAYGLQSGWPSSLVWLTLPNEPRLGGMIPQNDWRDGSVRLLDRASRGLPFPPEISDCCCQEKH